MKVDLSKKQVYDAIRLYKEEFANIFADLTESNTTEENIILFYQLYKTIIKKNNPIILSEALRMFSNGKKPYDVFDEFEIK